MFNSLKFKLIIITFLIVSVIMSLSTLRDIKQTENKLLEAQKEKAVLLSDRIAHTIMVLMLENKWRDLQPMMETLANNAKELKKIKIFRPANGIIVISSDPKEVGREIHKEDMEMFKKGRGQDAFLVKQEGLQYASKLTVLENQPVCHRCHGTEEKVLGVLDVEVSLSRIARTIEEFKRERLTEAIIAFMMISVSFFFVVGILIDRPVKKMVRTIRKIEEGDLSARMEEGKKNEFGLVAKSFNSMLETLESATREIEVCHAEQMQRAAKLASLGEIISGIAHEIKNPLAGISCAVQVIQSEMSEDDSKKQVTAEILHHIKRLDRTVKDLLNYARPKPPQFLPMKIDDVLSKAIFFVYPEAKKHNVAIETDIEGEVSDVMMDPDQMQQVFLNLIINAIQAMPGGGELKIVVSEAEKDKEGINDSIKERLSGEKMLTVSFKDTGTGIENEYIESIFDPFFTRKSKGTGLGLAISHRIIQEHGGEITVSSEAGKGSEFDIYLPVTQKKQLS